MGNRASGKGGIKVRVKNNNNRTKITLCWADFFFLFGLICCCNFIFGLFEDIIGLFSCVIWLFVMCGECCNFGLFELFAVILINLSPLFIFFFF